MLVRIAQVLTQAELAALRNLLARAPWSEGGITAGSQSTQAKNNEQLPEESELAQQARSVVQQAVSRNALFFTAALPRRIYPPLFNRYQGERNAFGNHIDNAIRRFNGNGLQLRTDLSATLFLSAPDEYDGGELVIEDQLGPQSIKLAAGDMLLYSATTVHRVEPVRCGARLASFFWVESMVRSSEQRRLLFELDQSISALRARQGDDELSLQFAGCYHNLLRLWADA